MIRNYLQHFNHKTEPMKRSLLAILFITGIFSTSISAPFSGQSAKNIVVKSFYASSDGKLIKLSWELSEMEHDVACMIERSADGISFEVIATIDIRKGFSGLKTFSDKPSESGQYYYRLFLYKSGYIPFNSSIVIAKLGSNYDSKQYKVSNPIQDELVVRGAFTKKNIHVEMIDMNGQLKLSAPVGITNEDAIRVNTGNLGKGIYMVRVSEKTDAGLIVILTNRVIKNQD